MVHWMARHHGGDRDMARFTLEEVLRPLAIAGMLTCIAVSLSQVLVQMVPTWPTVFFSVFVFFVSLESIHAQRLTTRRRMDARDRFRFRFVEWVTILLITRFGPYLRYGGQQLVADVAMWSEKPSSFFSVGFIVTSLIVAAFWFIAERLSRTVKELEAAAIERALPVTDPGSYLRSTMPHHGRTDRQSRLNYIVGLFFGGGVFLLLLTGFSRVDVRDMILLQHPAQLGDHPQRHDLLSAGVPRCQPGAIHHLARQLGAAGHSRSWASWASAGCGWCWAFCCSSASWPPCCPSTIRWA